MKEKYEELIVKGFTTKQIGNEFGISQASVKRMLKKLGLQTIHTRVPSNITKTQLEEFIQENLSSYDIANKLGIGQTTVRYWLKQYGLKTVRKRTLTSQCLIDGYKICPKCQDKLALTKDNFYITKTGRIHSWCKKCNDAISWEKQKQMKLKAVGFKGGKCCLCGYNKYVGSLDFHHVDPTSKDFALAELRTYCWEKIAKELDKCILVCRNCHGEIHGNVVAAPGLEPRKSPYKEPILTT